MLIKNAIMATSQARELIGNPRVFQPLSAKKAGKYWLVKADIGALDNILVTVRMPERMLREV